MDVFVILLSLIEKKKFVKRSNFKFCFLTLAKVILQINIRIV